MTTFLNMKVFLNDFLNEKYGEKFEGETIAERYDCKFCSQTELKWNLF